MLRKPKDLGISGRKKKSKFICIIWSSKTNLFIMLFFLDPMNIGNWIPCIFWNASRGAFTY